MFVISVSTSSVPHPDSVVTSQSLTVLSLDPDVSSLPSGDQYASIYLGGEVLGLVGRQVIAEAEIAVVRRQSIDSVHVILERGVERIPPARKRSIFGRKPQDSLEDKVTQSSLNSSLLKGSSECGLGHCAVVLGNGT